ncbi:O-methyltransferase [Marinobacter salarius]|uniref:O-methyltransferase n=1 Tax=Marinobacter salarius TaxID=1420917 RepID=UPI0018F21155|nr:O-methyltransferase [Marinobacter salarius]MBJ7299546.1 O-methyltransferase [Marinobacter salarius]HIO29617.1 O-methyltransferase [Marinobacter salarius]HIO98126.1 O-methyltransferase [Marinobacter salarius]
MKLKELLEELETLGKENDASVEQKDRKYLNITRDTGEFLSVLIKAGAVRQVLEIGTSNGYSTLWIASALPEDGHVTTLEVSPFKISQAKSNFKRANLDHKITVVQMGAVDYLGQASRLYDLVFLDADRASYVQVVDQIVSLIRPGGILVCDNAVSHAEELREFIDFVDSTGGFTTTTVPVGKGEFVACKKT